MVERDSIWDMITGAENLESFSNKVVPELYLRKEVPESIRQNIDISRKLLIHSFYEYEFIDISLTHSVFTLEKALKIRFKQVIGSDWMGSFFNLSKWFFENGYFETENFEVINQLREIRNGKVHEIDKTLGGLVFLNKAQTPIDLINDIFEDVQLRHQRKCIKKDLNAKLWELVKGGGLLVLKGKKYIVLNPYVVFVDNKGGNETVYCLFLPIYDLTPYKNDQHPIQHTYDLKIKDFVFNDKEGLFEGINCEDGSAIQVMSMDDKNRERFEKWNAELLDLKDSIMVKSLVDIPINRFYDKALRGFHKDDND